MAGGSKRRRKAPPASASKEDSKPAARKKTNDEPSFLSALYDVLRSISQSADFHSAGALLLNNKAWILDGTPTQEEAGLESIPLDQACCYALVFVTHVLHRVTTASAEQAPLDETTTKVLAGWSRLLMAFVDRLVPSCSKWDKAVGSSRHVLARVMASVTGAALSSLTSETVDTRSMISATLTLEEAFLNMPSRLPVYGQSNEFMTDASEQDKKEWPMNENPDRIAELAAKTNALFSEMVKGPLLVPQAETNPFWTEFGQANVESDICNWNAVEWACLDSLAKAVSAADNKSRKQSGRGQGGEESEWSAAWDAFAKESKSSQIVLDGRLASRRWAAVMMDWYLQAGPRILVKAQALLSMNDTLDDVKDTGGWRVPGQVLPVVLIGRWARILCEASNRSGIRPPSIGGFDSYLKQLLPVVLRGSKGKVSKKTTKPTIRDQATVTIYSIIESHARCLKLSIEDDLPFCPWIPDIIHDFALAAAGCSQGTESAECVDRIEHAAAAYIPATLGDCDNDWILKHFGLSKLFELLFVIREDSSTKGVLEGTVVEAGALEIPSTLSSKPSPKKKKGDGPKEWCSYGGVYIKNEQGNKSLEKLMLHIRGYGIPKQSKSSEVSTSGLSGYIMSRWFTLIDKAMYVDFPAVAIKEKARQQLLQRPNKRRRKDTKEFPLEHSISNEPTTEKIRSQSVLSCVRCKIIAKVLRILDEFALPQSSLLRKLLPTMNQFLLDRGATLLLECNMKLHTALFRERPKAGERLPDTSSEGTSIISSHENDLWSSLVEANATFGSGRKDNLLMESKNEDIFADRRLEIYKKISTMLSIKYGENSWPLWLPTPLRVFVSCNLCAEKMIGSHSDVNADRFILHGFLKSLNVTLSHPRDLISEAKGSVHPCVETELPLSLLDARVLVGACARLDDAGQRDFLEMILDSVNDHLKSFADGNHACLLEQREVSTFLGRVVATVAHLATLVGCTAEYRRSIQRSLCDSFSRRLGSWIPTDQQNPHETFNGILTNWESTDLPDGVRTKESLPGSVFHKLQLLIQVAFKLGFKSMHSDYGYLLYAAWNLHGKSSLWNPAKDRLLISTIDLEDPCSAILSIRNDLCLVHRRVRSDQGILAKSTISKSLDRSLGGGSPRTIIDNLKTLVEKGSEHIHNVLSKLSQADSHQLPVEMCALLESLSICVSFGLSFMTVTDSTFFSELASKQALTVRPRGYSTDSERNDSDADSTCSNDARASAAERLSEVCRAFGAAPTHPDWLDSGCSLRYGVTRSEVRSLAISAMNAFRELIKLAVNCREKNILQLAGEDPSSSRLFLQTVPLLSTISGSNEVASDGEALKMLASLCNVSDKTAKVLVNGLGGSLKTSSSDFWCTNASQQIIGELNSLIQSQLILPSEIGTSELRATGDWEIALAVSLLSGFFDSEDNTDFRLLTLSRWSNLVLSTLEWMVPACALLHFGLQSSGKTHPLKASNYNINDYLTNIETFADYSSPTMRLSGPQREAVFGALGVISSAVTSKEKVSHALATHLIGSVREYRPIMHVGRAVLSVAVLDKLLNGPYHGVALEKLVSAIVENMKSLDRVSLGWPLTRLLVACTHDTKEEINSLTLGRIALNDVILSEISAWQGELQHGSSPLGLFASKAVSVLTGLLRRSSLLSPSTVRFVMEVLSSLSIVERGNTLEPKLNRLIGQELVKQPETLWDSVIPQDISKLDDRCALYDLSNFCLAPFLSDSRGDLSDYVRSLSESLHGLVHSPQQLEIPLSLFNLYFLCGAYLTKLDDIGNELMSTDILNVANERAVNSFITFVSTLSTWLEKDHTEVPNEKTCENTDWPLCSFVLKEGFQEQHWYNCRTCDLTGEKGCCSTCASTCHDGHDVVYARFSSFFCDCGAESSKSKEDSSAPQNCRCLAPPEKNVRIFSDRNTGKYGPSHSAVLETPVYAHMAVSAFRDKSHRALEGVRAAVARDGWIPRISNSLFKALEEKKVAETAAYLTRPMASFTNFEIDKSSSFVELEDFAILHSSKPGTFEKLSQSDMYEVNRNLMTADSRARVVVCEGTRLHFFALPDLRNDSFASNRFEFERSDIPLFNSYLHELKEVAGIKLCLDNERLLLIWSRTQACILVVKPTWDGVVKRILLPFGCSSNIIGCHWLPGIERCVAIGCTDSVRFIKHTEVGSSTVAIALFGPTLNGTIKDFVIVPQHRGFAVEGWKVYMLLDSGDLYEVSIGHDDVLSGGERTLMVDNKALVSSFSALDDDSGEKLDYLEGGGLIMCQTKKKGTVGIFLENGSVKRIICFIAPGSSLTPKTDCTMTGPFTHWHCFWEHDSGGHSSLHLCCFGKVVGSKASVMLCFAADDSFSRQVSKSFEGCVEGSYMCTLPTIEDRAALLTEAEHRAPVEKIVISALTSSGTVVSFIEAIPIEACHSWTERVPITIFEKFERVAGDKLSFHVDGITEDIGERLLRDNDEFLVSPRPEGFTMNISFANTDVPDESSLVVAGLRVQVGKASVSRIPSCFFVEGRKIPLKKAESDWYAVVLSTEEVAQSVRKGFVTVKVDASGGSTPVIDSCEIYGIPRSHVGKWLVPLHNHRAEANTTAAEAQSLERLVSGIHSLCCLKRIRNGADKKVFSKDLLQSIVYGTAFGYTESINKSVAELIDTFEDEIGSSSQSFLDITRVSACSDFVKQSRDDLDATHFGEPHYYRGERFMAKLEACLRRASDIAKNRPGGYLKAVETKEGSLGSIALPASLLLERESLRHIATDRVVIQLTDLCLIEMAITGGSPMQAPQLDHFAALKRLLQSQTGRILVATCRSVQQFCVRFQSGKLTGNEPDPFAAQTMGAFYACDSCSHFPIKGTRYTFTKDHHSFDLCEKCYEKASNCASSNQFRKGRVVVVDDKTIGDDSAKLSCNEVRMMEAVPEETSTPLQRETVYEEFFGNLFVSLVSGLMSNAIEKQGFIEADLVQLATDLVNLSETDCRTDRKKRLAKKIVEGLSRLVASPNIGRKEKQSMVACLSALSQLVVSDREAQLFYSCPQSTRVEGTTEQSLVSDRMCDLHGSPLQIRQFHGGGRKFVSCKADRCDVFAWVDDKPGKAVVDHNSVFDRETALSIWELITADFKGKSLADSLCTFVDMDNGGDLSPKRQDASFQYTFEMAMKDIADGVVLGLLRTRNISVSQYIQLAQTLPKDGESVSNPRTLLDVCMELLSLTAPATKASAPNWHRMLCRTIGSEQSQDRKNLAKTALYRLCGADQDTYHSVRDHFAMWSKLHELNEHSMSLFEQALIVRRKAHVCGKGWRSEFDAVLSRVNGLEFLGVRNLVPEGAMSTGDLIKINSSLEEMLVIAKRRNRNWQAFCRASKETLEQEGFDLAPLSVVLSLAILLEGEPQLRAMKLCELACVAVEKQKKNPQLDPSVTPVPTMLPIGNMSPSDAVLAFAKEIVLNGRRAELRRVACIIASQMLQGAASTQKVFPDLMIALENGVGERGKNGMELIALLTSITPDLTGDPKIAEYAQSVEKYFLEQVSTMRHHRANGDFLLCESRSSTSQRKRFDLGFCVHCSKSHSIVHSVVKRTETSERQQTRNPSHAEGGTWRSNRNNTQAPGDPLKSDWIEGQVSPFSRARVQSLRENQTSDEFCSYIELKNRVVLSEIHLEIHDPRGRFVKTITVFCAPRPVSETRELLSERYRSKWEKVGTMSLSRGGSRASIALSKPMIAANLKIEYTEFYERPGDARQPDGGFIVHCPRCSRVVQNAHGVCGNCGEVAFQCRKCRHINYDRLDAFLCIECGYCASGTFSFDIVSAAASNALAITNDREYAKFQKMLVSCLRIREDTRVLLKERHTTLVRVSKRTEKESEWGSEDLRRAYNGQMPLIPWQRNDPCPITLESLGKEGTVVRAVARPESLDMAGRGSTDRRCTVNALLRSGRSSSSTSGSIERRQAEDIVVQQIRAEMEDEESDILNLLEQRSSGRGVALDSSDPISRLLARVRSRHEQSENDLQEEAGAVSGTGAGGVTSGAVSGTAAIKSKPMTGKECIEICERLHILMREAEREAFELKQRIQAWERLNRDDLAGLYSLETSEGFSPCRCWNCSSSIASGLLSLWHALFQADTSKVNPSPELVEQLLQSDSSSSSVHRLQDIMRSTIESIATRSSVAAPWVLGGLRKRLAVGQDIYAAEVLGRIVESDPASCPLHAEFVQLASEQLERQQRLALFSMQR